MIASGNGVSINQRNGVTYINGHKAGEGPGDKVFRNVPGVDGDVIVTKSGGVVVTGSIRGSVSMCNGNIEINGQPLRELIMYGDLV